MVEMLKVEPGSATFCKKDDHNNVLCSGRV